MAKTGQFTTKFKGDGVIALNGKYNFGVRLHARRTLSAPLPAKSRGNKLTDLRSTGVGKMAIYSLL